MASALPRSAISVKRYGNFCRDPLDSRSSRLPITSLSSFCRPFRLRQVPRFLRIIAPPEPIPRRARSISATSALNAAHPGGAARYRDGVPGLCALLRTCASTSNMSFALELCVPPKAEIDARVVPAPAPLLVLQPLSGQRRKPNGTVPALAPAWCGRWIAPLCAILGARAFLFDELALQSRRQSCAGRCVRRNQGIVAGAEDHDGLCHP